jgi:hypothetical protein
VAACSLPTAVEYPSEPARLQATNTTNGAGISYLSTVITRSATDSNHRRIHSHKQVSHGRVVPCVRRRRWLFPNGKGSRRRNAENCIYSPAYDRDKYVSSKKQPNSVLSHQEPRSTIDLTPKLHHFHNFKPALIPNHNHDLHPNRNHPLPRRSPEDLPRLPPTAHLDTRLHNLHQARQSQRQARSGRKTKLQHRRHVLQPHHPGKPSPTAP